MNGECLFILSEAPLSQKPQCGFCTPGMTLSAYYLLQQNPQPTEAGVKDGLAGNVGKALNPQHVERQDKGATVMGLGHTLMERLSNEAAPRSRRKRQGHTAPTQGRKRR